MTAKLTPADFKFRLLEHAEVIRRNQMRNPDLARYLDEQTRVWLIREPAWREFRASKDYLTAVTEVYGEGGSCRRELMGIPVRLTFDDAPDTPMIQLMIEPKLQPRKRVV